MKSRSSRYFNRRDFLKVSASGLLGAGISSQASAICQKGEQQIPQISDFRFLGSTGFKVSCIGIGSSNRLENFHETLLKTGMNYFDTSPLYGNETAVGNAIRSVDRDSVFITVKFYPKVFSKEEFMSDIPFTTDEVLKSFYSSLEKLKTDYVDCFMFQSASSSKMVKNKAFHDAFKQLKRDKKVKFCGIACHGQYWIDEPNESMEQICQTAIDDGRIDIILLVYNFLQYDQGERILKECAKKGIGTLVMKGNPILRYRAGLESVKNLYEDSIPEGKPTRITDKFKKEIDEFENFKIKNGIKDESELSNSAIKFILDNPDVNSYLYGFKTYESMQQVIPLSGQHLTARNKALLTAYSEKFGSYYCRHACGICESACPHRVPVNRLLRYWHYYAGNGDEAYAIRKYNSFEGPKANLCTKCEGFCQKLCPYGVHAKSLLINAHQQLCLNA